MSDDRRQPASFRDPSGFLFAREGKLYRQVNQAYREDYRLLMASGLYDELCSAGLLIPHKEVDVEPAEPETAFRVIEPEPLQFVSYPYEWCFSQLKRAAVTTLEIQRRALARGLSLKDCSAYNVQFHCGGALLIDTLSFETYREGEPWFAYRQFCQHFLAPLALMAWCDARLSQLWRVFVDGVPLDLASRLLPARTRLSPGLLMHVHVHASAQRRFSGARVSEARGSRRMGRIAFLGLLDSLTSAIQGLTWRPAGTEWADYYSESGYTAESLGGKGELVRGFLARLRPRQVWDLGANTGVFSRLASRERIPTVAFDSDAAAVERNYLACVQERDAYLLPLVLDLTNPSPAIGWANEERASLIDRGPADTVMALALLHHLAISNNVPLDRVASFLSTIGRSLIIEFVPKSDPQVQRLLANRADIFSEYSQEGFIQAFATNFRLLEQARVPGTERSVYLMERL
jgi:hypothetical protein